jgi:dienelactone hydrolase
MTQDAVFLTSEGHALAWTLHGSELPLDGPCLVYLHGFKGFKDWGFVPELGQRLNQAGIRLLAMNFSHNGIGDTKDEFTELDKFRMNTFSLELQEAVEFVQACHAGKLNGVAADVPMAMLGHSRGGGIALLAAAQLPMLRCVVTWAAVATFLRYPEHMLQQWEKEGQLEVKNARTGQTMHLGWQLHTDLMANIEGKLNIEKAVAALNLPMCIIHGTLDEAVPANEAEAIASWAQSGTASLHLIPDAGHTFGAQHPFQGTPAALELAFETTLAFIHPYLQH